jgi:hypothetical protein
MQYCRRCRVVIDGTLSKCPLCHQLLLTSEENALGMDIFSHPQMPFAQEQVSFWRTKTPLSVLSVLRHIAEWGVLGSIAAIIILLGLDLYHFNTTGIYRFSTYIAIITLVYSIGILLILRFLNLRTRTLWLIIIATALYLLALDLGDFKITWSVTHGLPLLLGSVAPFILLSALWRHSKQRGFNILGYSCLALATSLLSFEIVLSQSSKFRGWSIISFTGLIGLALIFLYLHFISKKSINLERAFAVKR